MLLTAENQSDPLTSLVVDDREIGRGLTDLDLPRISTLDPLFSSFSQDGHGQELDISLDADYHISMYKGKPSK